jgi:ABC-type phosphate/phosphonate transport system substrate-binding protein
MENSTPQSLRPVLAAIGSRRSALALMFGSFRWLGAGCWSPTALAAAGVEPPLRFAIAESVVGDVNMNDARPAMRVWIQRMRQEVDVEFDSKIFNTAREIQERVRLGGLDVVALNVIEYRPIAEYFDSSQIVTSGGAAGSDQYLLLANRKSGIRSLAELKGRRLCMLKNPKMCMAPTWLSTILDDGHLGAAEQFFSSVAVNSKFLQVVLPVFFGQADACLTTKRAFETMCEMNPQVGRDLTTIAGSPAMVVNFYVFRKNYQSANREKLIRALLNLRATPVGGQLAALFQFDELTTRDASCLTPAFAVLDAAERARARLGTGGRK